MIVRFWNWTCTDKKQKFRLSTDIYYICLHADLQLSQSVQHVVMIHKLTAVHTNKKFPEGILVKILFLPGHDVSVLMVPL